MSKCLFVLVAALALSVAPLGAQQPAGPARLSVPYEMFTLPNGLTVILNEDHSVPKVAVNVWYHVGSSYEKPGRTGFAHLFEHLMFEGSGHVKPGQFDNLLEAAGGSNNGSTTEDRTNYYEEVPSNALDLPLYLESDRMGYLLDIVTPQTVDSQRDVVKNELRQRYQNAPYGQAFLRMTELLYPKDHPYHWPVIGYMDDLSAASQEDVVDFFKSYYAPGNASLVISGDITPAEARKRVEYWFGDVKPGPRIPLQKVPAAELTGVIKETLQDRVQLPRIYLAWLTPGFYEPGDAELDMVSGVLAGGKSSRLYKRLVYDLQLAQDVDAAQNSSRYGSIYTIIVTARPSQDPPDQVLARLTAVVDEELDKLRVTPPDAREVERARNSIESSFYSRIETVAGKADQLNAYFTATGNPDYFAEDLGRYQSLAPDDIQAAIKHWLPADRRLELSVVPQTETK
ncbi:MAG TPA: pitrilysin family protein [Vicinamibacterales bacterium]|jgi:zinc protease|nr:pitrilysin family protein [Vicinamibacterales bacterium]